MRCFETLIYLRTWADGPAPLTLFVQEVERQATARGVAAELVQPIVEADETDSATGPLAMVKALGGADESPEGQPIRWPANRVGRFRANG